jgi:hypothetical protein
MNVKVWELGIGNWELGIGNWGLTYSFPWQKHQRFAKSLRAYLERVQINNLRNNKWF